MFTSLTWFQTGIALVGLTLGFSVLFLSMPSIDLVVSGWFFDPVEGFMHASNPVFRFIRNFLIDGMRILALVVFLLTWQNGFLGVRRAVPFRVWGFISLNFLIGPIWMVNGVFKAYWGRARPVDVTYFNGDLAFSPPLLISDQCTNNCSFVSGEGSALATIIIVFAIVLWPNLKGIWRMAALYLALPLASFGIALRVITGRHFFSDTIFAILFGALIIWAYYRVFDMKNYRHALTWQAFTKDIRRE